MTELTNPGPQTHIVNSNNLKEFKISVKLTAFIHKLKFLAFLESHGGGIPEATECHGGC